jgi:hypothetical protein
MNSPRLKSYHNPENVDESLVPKGWRFRYADEMGLPAAFECRRWHADGVCAGTFPATKYLGALLHRTYIVPVA